MSKKIRILGIDPGLRYSGWGVIESEGSHIKYVAEGTFKSNDKLSLAERLKQIHNAFVDVVKNYTPDEAAVEETFVNKNPNSTLKLGQARGVALLAPALFDVPVFEYSPNAIKKAVVGVGHADKNQMKTMVKILLSAAKLDSEHSIDALAAAICHLNSRTISY